MSTLARTLKRNIGKCSCQKTHLKICHAYCAPGRRRLFDSEQSMLKAAFSSIKCQRRRFMHLNMKKRQNGYEGTEDGRVFPFKKFSGKSRASDKNMKSKLKFFSKNTPLLFCV